MNRRLPALAASLLTIVGSLFVAQSVTVLAAAPSRSLPHPHYGVSGPPHRIDLRHLITAPGVTHPSLRVPLLPPTHHAPGKGRRQGVVTIATPAHRSEAAAPRTEQQLASFPVMSLQHQVALFGSDQSVQPPDTQLAAGPTMLAEATNSTLSEWSKSGSLLDSTDLNVFFHLPAGFALTDPRILYDAASGRWLLSGFAFDSAHDSKLYVAISATSDPSALWTWYLYGTTTGVVTDQPMMGVSLDKVVISFDDYSSTTIAQQTFVFQKSDLVAGGSVHWVFYSPDATRFRIVPSQSLSSTNTDWLVYNNADCPSADTCNQGSPTIGVVAINGTPLAADVTWSETDLAISATTAPPEPHQPGGLLADANDDRFTSAVWQNGMLWVSGTDSCFPNGDSTMRACMRLVAISTVGTPSVAQDIDAASNGFDVYYPAVTLDNSGDLFIAFSESSPSMYPSALGVESLAETPTTFENAILIASGQTSYSGTRWGDYSGAAQDPLDPADVWLTAEYQANSLSPGDWGTATARAAIEPTITNVSPSSSPGDIQQHVTITGAHFQSGAAVLFGAKTATAVVVVNSTQITASTPTSRTLGPVTVTVNQPDGTSASLPSAYTYTRDVVYQSSGVPPQTRTGVNQSAPGNPGTRTPSVQPIPQSVAAPTNGGSQASAGMSNTAIDLGLAAMLVRLRVAEEVALPPAIRQRSA